MGFHQSMGGAAGGLPVNAESCGVSISQFGTGGVLPVCGDGEESW